MPPLIYQTIKIPMVSGVDTKADPKQLPPNRLSVLENARFDKVGTVNKRSGSGSNIGTGTTTTGLFRRAKQLLLSRVTELYARNDAMSAWQSNVALGFRQWKVGKDPVYGRATTAASNIGRCDYAFANGVEVVAWEDGSSVFARPRNITSKSISGSFVSVASASEPRVLGVGTRIFLFYRSATNTLAAQYLDTTTGSWTSVGSVATDYATAGAGTYDIAADTSTAHLLLAWNLTAANGYKLTRLSGTTGAVVTAAVSQTNYDIGVAVAPCPDGRIVVVSASTTDLYADLYSSALSRTAGPTDLGDLTASGRASVTAKCKSTVSSVPGEYDVYVLWQGGIATNIGPRAVGYRTNNSVNALTMFNSTGPSGARSLGIASKWWEDSATGKMHACFVHDGEDASGASVYPTLFALNEDGYFMGRMLPGSAAGRTADDFRHFFPTSVVAAATNDYRMAQVERESVQDQVDSSQAIQVISMQTDFAAVRKTAETGGSLYLPGAWLWQWDGQRIYEHGFSMYPVNVPTPSAASGGAAFTTGQTHSYKVVYERRTAAGEVERSAPSAAVVATYTTTTGDTATVTVPTYVTGNQNDEDVYIVIYRTEVNPGADSLYYRLTSLVNDTAVSSKTYVDDATTDLALINNAVDYFSSGELDHIPPPPCHVITAGKERLFLSDGALVYYSKLRNPGGPVAFNEALYMQIPQAGGDITGLSILNEMLVVFRENAIYCITGDGPNNLGQGAFGSPQLVSLDVGCSDQRSIVNMPLGVMFKSDKGIYLLDRNLQTSYIGAPVEDYNSQDCTGTLLHEDKNEVRFLTSSGSVLVFDYFASQWSVDTGRAGVGIVQVNGTIYYATAAGAVYAETPSTFTDASAGYVMKATTGWIRLDTMHGLMKVRRFLLTGAYKSSGTVRVRVAYDYSETFVDTYNYTLANETPMKFRGRLSRMKCSAIKLEVSDVSPTGEGFSLSEIALEVGMQQGLARLGTSYTINES